MADKQLALKHLQMLTQAQSFFPPPPIEEKCSAYLYL